MVKVSLRKKSNAALLDNRIDLAVHSLKDLPTEHIPGLTLAAVPERESTGDVLVSNRFRSLHELPPRARIGTGSTRRQAQLLHQRPDLEILDIRGNVDTRLRKLDAGEYDAIILAEAGLKRLELTGRIAQVLPREQMLPAVGQGALGIEARSDDAATLALLQPLNESATRASVLAERAMLRTLRGGCLAPVGAWGRIERDQLHLDGVVLSNDGIPASLPRRRPTLPMLKLLVSASRERLSHKVPPRCCLIAILNSQPWCSDDPS